MTLTLFVTLVSILSIVCSLFTEAIKKVVNVTKPTLLVLILSAIIGWGGGVITYILMGIAFTETSIICLALLAPTIWLCATLGYDKVIEIIKSFGNVTK